MVEFAGRWMMGPVYVKAFSFRLDDFLTLLILPGLLVKHNLLVGLAF